MTLESIFSDKSIKSKQKVNQIGEWLIGSKLTLDELLVFTVQQTKSNQATCIEAIEYATRKIPNLADEALLKFVVNALNEDEPRIKWESAKVIGNIAKLYPFHLSDAIKNLLKNTSHEETVVRWATALALGEILKLKTIFNDRLLPEIEKLALNEKDNGVKKKYLDAIKKVKK